MSEATRILFVDDEKRLRDTFQKLLGSRGYDVFTAEDGQVALDILSKSPVDTMLLDLKMPVMGGEEVLEITRTQSTRRSRLLLSRAMGALILQ